MTPIYSTLTFEIWCPTKLDDHERGRAILEQRNYVRYRSKKLSTDSQQRIMDKLNERVVELCQVGSVISDHMRYVGRQWQRAIETLT